MTTKVTIDTRDGRRVEVTAVDYATVPPMETRYIIDAGTIRVFDIWEGRTIQVRELKS